MFNWTPKRRKATLADCPACGAESVHPVFWRPHDETHWWMLLRCGGCGASRELTVPDPEADRFDHALDRAQAVIRREADRLSRNRLAEEAEAFAAALELDLISAEDFAR
jgi:transcription elongation factor Elf1